MDEANNDESIRVDASERVDVLSSTDTDGYTLSVAEAAAVIGRSVGTVRRLIRDGDLPAQSVQGERTEEYRLRRVDVDDMLGRLNAQTTKRPRIHAHDERVDDQTTRRLRVHENDEHLPAMADRDLASVVQHPAVQALIVAAVEQATAPLAAANERQASELTATREERARLQDAIERQAEVLGVERGRRQALEEELERMRALSAAPPEFVAAHHAVSAELGATRERVIAALRDLDRAEGENAKLRARQGHWWAFWRRRGGDQHNP